MQKTILISGATRGIGKATVRQLLHDGHKVVAFSRNLEKVQALEKELGADFPKDSFLILQADVTDETSLAHVVEKTLETFGAIDVLINNAGYGIFGNADEFDMEEYSKMLDTNTVGVARLTKLVIPGMKKQKQGVIINLISVAGKAVTPQGEFYSATKFALTGYSKGLRLELKPFRIKVCVINPGMVQTDFFTEEVLRRRTANYGIPFPPPMLDPEDIARTVSFVVGQSPNAEIQDIDIMPF